MCIPTDPTTARSDLPWASLSFGLSSVALLWHMYRDYRERPRLVLQASPVIKVSPRYGKALHGVLIIVTNVGGKQTYLTRIEQSVEGEKREISTVPVEPGLPVKVEPGQEVLVVLAKETVLVGCRALTLIDAVGRRTRVRNKELQDAIRKLKEDPL